MSGEIARAAKNNKQPTLFGGVVDDQVRVIAAPLKRADAPRQVELLRFAH